MQSKLLRCVSKENSETGRSLMARSNHRVYRKELDSDWSPDSLLPALTKGSFVAMKMFSGGKNKTEMKELCEKEFNLLKECCHDNIVTVLEKFTDVDQNNPESWPSYFMELGHCSLNYVISTKGSDKEFIYPTGDDCYSWHHCLTWMRQVASAIDYLHGKARQIVHRDIKSSNVIMFDDRKNCKLCDFDMSKHYNSEAMTVNIGTWRWMAPEVRSSTDAKLRYDSKVDCYSFGVLICEVIFRQRPFDCYEQDCLLQNLNEIPSTLEDTGSAMSIIRDGERRSVQLQRHSSVFEFSDKLWQLINELLSWEPDARPDFRQVVSRLAVENPTHNSEQGLSAGPNFLEDFITDTGLRTNQTCPSIPRVWHSVRVHYVVQLDDRNESLTPDNDEQGRIVELLRTNSGGILSFYEEELSSNQQADTTRVEQEVTSEFSFTSGNILKHDITGSDHDTREGVARMCKTNSSLLKWMAELFQREPKKFNRLRSIQFRLHSPQVDN